MAALSRPGTPVAVAVPVAGGLLRGGHWPASNDACAGGASGATAARRTPDGAAEPTIVAIHDLTANHRWWAPLAEALDGRVSLLAADLRGRAGSAGLRGPWGLEQHVSDAEALTDLVEPAGGTVVLIGHGYGAWVAGALADRLGGRVAALVLADPVPAAGSDHRGPADLPRGRGGDEHRPDAAARRRQLDPTAARLDRVYANRDAYLGEWRSSPSFAGGLDRSARAAVLGDLRGTGFSWRPAVDLAAVDHDAADLTTILTDDPGRQPVHARRGLAVRTVTPADVTPGERSGPVDHLTLVLGRAGAAALADLLLGLTGPPEAPKDTDGVAGGR